MQVLCAYGVCGACWGCGAVGAVWAAAGVGEDGMGLLQDAVAVALVLVVHTGGAGAVPGTTSPYTAAARPVLTLTVPAPGLEFDS
jgi:hypothetical protein